MTFVNRQITTQLIDILNHGKSILLLGPRQTGKTTLLKHLEYHGFKPIFLNLANPGLRIKYERDPGILIQEIEANVNLKTTDPTSLFIIDEIQKVPALLDAVQYLIDNKTAQFILTGSSARKLRNTEHVNFLPGRVIPLYLSPLSYSELRDCRSNIALEELLFDGALPEIILERELGYRERLLSGYVTTYLEEEVRLEALVRNLGQFSKFLELAAAESGKVVNFIKLSQEIGVAQSTITAFYQILVDCLVVHRIEALTETKTRRKLQKSPKFLFYDLGVRRLAANEGRKPPLEYLGHLFEQYIGLELYKAILIANSRLNLKYWRDPAGAEVDWVLESPENYIPIEVKYTETPKLSDIKFLKTVMQEYNAKIGYLICRIPNKMKLSENIYALPWQELDSISVE